MPLDFSQILVVGVSSRALFNLEKENEIFKNENIAAFRKYQLEHEDELLSEGTAFPLIKSLLKLNDIASKQIVEVVVMSRNSPETGVRVLKSIKHFNLSITRCAFSGGEPLSPFIDAFDVDLFLSKDEKDVQKLSDTSNCATALIYDPPKNYMPEVDRVKFAFDADAVVFSEESEQIYKEKGIDAFHEHESKNEDVPLNDGPFAELLRKLSKIQEFLPTTIELTPLRIAIVTARNAPSHMRVVKTLRHWGVYVDEAYFMGGLSKDKVLEAFGAHIFFDDQETHLNGSSKVVPSGKVLYKTDSPLKIYDQRDN
ncbi:5'-nucleotidase [Leeuwenhoekiella aestuarii]|uniref:5'-nucleotidase n=1 Tax=Leeuwenhoekiella aestuarii TaxID=2249426 RepID=A0A4Q0NST2_9FLAO|nr:5'-nucleotidase [Leeuwenhoekiella aestuarii]RXG14205.1 5'-nucleotidase [Leeuwenhoekiella aestuarii]RXG18954.1 5'-nucleotidase [Leeuwenhoekiella aestuarii]